MASVTHPTTTTNGHKEPPIIVAIALPADGHTNGIISITSHLHKLGMPVYFVGGPQFEPQITKSGATFINNPFTLKPPPPDSPEAKPPATGPARMSWNMRYIFLPDVPSAFNAFKGALEMIKEKHPEREIVILHEAFSNAVTPYYYGAPLPKGYKELPKVLNYNASLNVMSSKDLFPFTSDFLPPKTEEDREHMAKVKEEWWPVNLQICEFADKVFASLGCTRQIDGWMWDVFTKDHYRTLFAYSPGLDYARSDQTPNVRFLGALPVDASVSEDMAAKHSWAELQENAKLPPAERKKVVFVSQGTAHNDYAHLIIPSLRSLSSLPNILVIAVLGKRGATLPPDLSIPPNARVADYFSYNAILSHADVFITNAGFGGFTQSIMSGVPMVLAGEGADKKEVSNRAEWRGLGVNLATRTPSEERIREGVMEVLEDGKYKRRVEEVRRENVELDPWGQIERLVWECVA